jgi:hypothetical protein
MYWARSVQSILTYSVCPRSILLSCQLRLGNIFWLSNQSLYAVLSSFKYATIFAHLIYLDLISQLMAGSQSMIWSPTMCISSHFGPYIFTALFSNSVWSFLNVRDQVSHPYTTRGQMYEHIMDVLLLTSISFSDFLYGNTCTVVGRKKLFVLWGDRILE